MKYSLGHIFEGIFFVSIILFVIDSRLNMDKYHNLCCCNLNEDYIKNNITNINNITNFNNTKKYIEEPFCIYGERYDEFINGITKDKFIKKLNMDI